MLFLQLLFGLSTLPWMVIMQTYYMNFVFNNNRYIYANGTSSSSGKGNLLESKDETTNKLLDVESETLEVSSMEHSHSRDISHYHKSSTSPPIIESQSENLNTDESLEESGDISLRLPTTESLKEKVKKNTKNTKTTKKILSSTSRKTTTTTTTGKPSSKDDVEEEPLEITTENPNQDKPKWQNVVPHPDDFFHYPLAKCHEDMDLHEVFGIRLDRDRGLAAKVYCNFSNSWGGPWLLMHRMELPARLHMRRWFFGYVSDDFKDLNINFLGLAHLINNMRIAMLILGQDNQDRLVYNLYDDVVISGFNDLFMLRKAHLIEANTTDLLFISVGDVLESYGGRNRSCPFKVLGSWWGGHTFWKFKSNEFCVFPVDRDVQRPGYMAIFIKPSPFAINNTALYDNAITTRRPWVTTANANLMAMANNDTKIYRNLMHNEFNLNKKKVKNEIERRKKMYPHIEKERAKEAKNQTDLS